MTAGRRTLTGNRAFWALVCGAAAIRTGLVLSACCLLPLLAERIADRGVPGLWNGRPSALPATVLVLLIAAGMTAGAATSLRAARATVVFLRAIRRAAVETPPGTLGDAAAHAGLPAGRVLAVCDTRPFAVTYGLFRPRVAVSTGLLTALNAAELHAVLVHERAHVRARDPLKTLLVRVLTGRLFFLPLLARLAERFTAGSELAADRRAIAACGRRALAGALLKTVEHPTWPTAAPAAAMGSAKLLNARITQLETGTEPPPARLTRTRLTLTIAMGGLLVWSMAGALAFSPSALHCGPAAGVHGSAGEPLPGRG